MRIFAFLFSFSSTKLDRTHDRPVGVNILAPLEDQHRFGESVTHLAHHKVDAHGIFVTHREGKLRDGEEIKKRAIRLD
jgi:hypothetical protein